MSTDWESLVVERHKSERALMMSIVSYCQRIPIDFIQS